jgi:hypothetical protein
MKNVRDVVSLWFGVFMVILVLAGAIAFMFTDFMEDRLHGNKRIVLTVIFLGYAVFRGIRIYQVLKANRND